MIYNPGESSKEISVKVMTADIDEIELIEMGCTGILNKLRVGKSLSAEEMREAEDLECVEKIDLRTVGRILTNSDGQIEVVYRENENDPDLKTFTRIIFSPNTPSLVAIIKRGAVQSSLSFEEGKRHVCTYVTPYMPFKVHVSASKVDNRLLEDGILHLEYVLCIDDTAPRHFVVSIEIKETPEDVFKKYFKD